MDMSSNIMRHLQETKFPADKEQIIAMAEYEPGTDTEEVIGLLSRIPERTYGSAAEVVEAVRKVA